MRSGRISAMPKDIPKQIGVLVRAARESAGLTQEQLASLTSIDKDSISLIERGGTFPSLRSMYDLAAGLKVRMGDLIPDEALAKSAARLKGEAEILALLRDVPDKQLPHLRDLIALFMRSR